MKSGQSVFSAMRLFGLSLAELDVLLLASTTFFGASLMSSFDIPGMRAAAPPYTIIFKLENIKLIQG